MLILIKYEQSRAVVHLQRFGPEGIKALNMMD
jgi:hypothetical protein